MRKSELAILFLILISLAAAFILLPRMPDQMASHWGTEGNVDSYMSRFWGLFMMPIIAAFILILFIIIPKIDPLKTNIKKFRKYYDSFMVLITIFLLYIYALTLAWNLNYTFNMNRMITPAIGLIIYYAGILTENAKRNWFIGIRTPWTLSSPKVWDKTNKLGGKLFKIAGVIALLGILFPSYTVWLILIPVLTFTVYIIVYSYLEYQKK